MLVSNKYSLLTLSLLIFSISALASKLQWSIKREIGEQTIWKFSLDKSVRASSQLVKDPGILSGLSNKEKLVKEWETKKRAGLQWLGIKKWHVTHQEWTGDTLSIQGNYIDKDGLVQFFEERHVYLKDRHVITLLTTTKKSLLNDSKVKNYFEIALNWERSK